MNVAHRSVTPRNLAAPSQRALVAACLCAIAISTAGCATDTPTSTDTKQTGGGAARVSLGDAISTIRLPGWHITTPRITALGYPAERLLLTSYPARRGGDCAPDSAARDLPADGALIYAFEYRREVGSPWTGLRRTDFPPRPAHFALRKRDLGMYECWRVPSYLIRFRSADRPFQVHIALGAHATSARRAQVLEILDGLRFSALPAPPPDPYAGWHGLHDATGDTLRTPPGWAAAVTPSPRRHAQPRTLFFTTNRPQVALPSRTRSATTGLPSTFPVGTLRSFPADGVLLWIREDRPGPATVAWPRSPARGGQSTWAFAPLTAGIAARWPHLLWLRVGTQQRQTRYSLWIVSGPRASAADRHRARLSAASFAFSVGSFRNRSCRRPCESNAPVQVIPFVRPGDDVSAAGLAQALRTNASNPAIGTCHRATPADRRRARSFARTRRLFICMLALREQPAATFDVQMLANDCFVAERRRRGQADYGCVL